MVFEGGLGSLVVDGREVVVAIASEASAGGWLVLTLTGLRRIRALEKAAPA